MRSFKSLCPCPISQEFSPLLALSLLCKCWGLCLRCHVVFASIIDPPGHGRIGGHYFRAWCPYVRTSITKTKMPCNANVDARKTKYSLQLTPCVNIMTTYWLWPDGSCYIRRNNFCPFRESSFCPTCFHYSCFYYFSLVSSIFTLVVYSIRLLSSCHMFSFCAYLL